MGKKGVYLSVRLKGKDRIFAVNSIQVTLLLTPADIFNHSYMSDTLRFSLLIFESVQINRLRPKATDIYKWFKTHSPTRAPSHAPTRKPTYHPSMRPTRSPTRTGTARPTKPPALRSTLKPTLEKQMKTHRPTLNPTRVPTPRPSYVPTGNL